MTEVAVRVAHLAKTFRVGREVVSAVSDVSFEVQVGGSLAIVGESGSGKTTTVRCLMGLETPTTGEIVVNGTVRGGRRPSPKERRRRSREMQMVFQDPYGSMNPRFTVRKTLTQALKVGGAADASRGRVDEMLDLVELPASLADARPRSLSGGQRQRVAIARALAADAEILVLDEAVAALDVSVQAQVLNLLSDLRDTRNLTLIFITHDLAVVRQIADDVIVMRKGTVVEHGPTDRTIDTPREEYTRNLIAAVPRVGWLSDEPEVEAELRGP
jgi:peptide/nickel transport system ATP-binding protein